ncbi:hypothetical protein HAZT_HAZT007972 [Hyalella azteca]|nr:hypothetical protein HAZT_HAZT007972 [Hyalella azteca]
MSNIYPPPPPPYEPPNPPPYAPLNPENKVYVQGVVPPGRSTAYVTSTNYGSIPTGSNTTIVVEPATVTSVLLVGGCPACRVGVLNEEFSLGGLCCAFWFFPIGILCCLAMRERRCTNCHATFP